MRQSTDPKGKTCRDEISQDISLGHETPVVMLPLGQVLNPGVSAPALIHQAPPTHVSSGKKIPDVDGARHDTLTNTPHEKASLGYRRARGWLPQRP